jgi:Protein of unknown function (DUF561)
MIAFSTGMSPLAQLPASLRTALNERRLLKVIAGLANFEAASVARVARAAAAGGADLIDVACDPELVRLAVSESGLPIGAVPRRGGGRRHHGGNR